VDEARLAVEAAARASYARLISFLSARSGDVAGAEDALADAFVAALRTWPTGGIPSKPDAWLLHAARRKLIDRRRRERTRDGGVHVLASLLAEAEDLSQAHAFPDERLELLFVCAHPAIDARVHTPLMLQVVLGLDAAAIAAAFLTPASTMGQRLSRAKAKIRETRIAFELPAGTELEPRLSAVLEAIYAAYGHGWEGADGMDAERIGLAEEALFLARVLVERLPDQPEALGLLALLEYCEARRPARRSANGEYVPMSEQDTRLWDGMRLAEAERLLRTAARLGRPGRFQLEAAVQSAHVERCRGRHADWAAIAVLYEGLVRLAPTFGALVGRAAAVAEAHGANAGLELLDQIPRDAVQSYQPYWATRAHLEQRLGREGEARAAFETALRLTRDPAVRRYLERAATTAEGRG
jgi:RNA polymerase sigma-70 factor (ECF subfamily)